MPEFWQQFPKAIDVEDGRLNVRLFPPSTATSMSFKGESKKRTRSGFTLAEEIEPVIDSLSMGSSTGSCSLHARVVRHRPRSFRTAPRLDRSRRSFRVITLRPSSMDLTVSSPGVRSSTNTAGGTYGEVYADHEAEHYAGRAPVISHYNNQYDLIYGLLLQYLRNGDRRWFELCDPLARHVIDIDIYHTTQDKAAYNGGLFWHTDHYRDAATSTHRGYSRYNYRPGDPFAGGGPSSNHNYSTGLLHYHYLTGDPNAREAVNSLADWVVNMDDGEQSVFGILDPTPTGNATYPGEPNYQGPCRGAATRSTS